MFKKKYLWITLLLPLATLYGQEADKDSLWHTSNVPPPRTLVQRFDKSVILSPEERAKIHARAEAKRAEIMMVIDSADISERYRLKLKEDLDANAYSERLKKFLIKYRKPNH